MSGCCLNYGANSLASCEKITKCEGWSQCCSFAILVVLEVLDGRLQVILYYNLRSRYRVDRQCWWILLLS